MERVGVTGPDALLLLAHALEVGPGEARRAVAEGRYLTAAQRERFAAGVVRRGRREPLQHITGLAPFRFVELRVGPGVFVPRPETELLVDIAKELLPAGGTALDAGTGSGAIAIALATERPDARILAVEASPEAHGWAKRNVERLAPGVELIHARFEDALPATPPLDLLVSNPPYVPEAAVPQDPEVARYDPAAALYSGEDGLDAVRALARLGLVALRPGGAIALEHGELQGAAVRSILGAHGWQRAETRQDLTGRDRHTVAWAPAPASLP